MIAAMAMAVLGAALPLAAATDERVAVVLLRLLAHSYCPQFVFLVPLLRADCGVLPRR